MYRKHKKRKNENMKQKEGCPPGKVNLKEKCVTVPTGWWPIGNGEIIRKTGINKDGCIIDAKTITKSNGSSESNIVMGCQDKPDVVIKKLGKHTDFESGLHATLKWIKKNKKIKGG